MAEDGAMKKKFDRWHPRLNDSSSDVREKAAEELVTVANSGGSVVPAALAALADALNALKKGDEDDYSCSNLLGALNDLEPEVMAKSTVLLDALMSAPLENEYAASRLMAILWHLLESGAMKLGHNSAHAVVKRAASVAKLAHQGGRRDALQIIDWGEDNL